MKEFWVYIMASAFNGTLYVGVTSDILKRVYEHKTNAVDGFTKDHHVHHLVFLEKHQNAEAAISREKRIKRWKREWKMNLIEQDNPKWEDLAQNWFSNEVVGGSLPAQG
jgi:putative endonuclease